MSTRPKSLRQVAERSSSLRDFGLNLRDWLHELRLVSSRGQALQMIEEQPPLLGGKMKQGALADAWLAAYAEHLAQKLHRPPPSWAFDPSRIARKPAFDAALDTPYSRALALAYAPPAFKRRNIFISAIDLPLRLRAGRPGKSVEEKRKTNAERQRRFRQARAEEIATLRAGARRA